MLKSNINYYINFGDNVIIGGSASQDLAAHVAEELNDDLLCRN